MYKLINNDYGQLCMVRRMLDNAFIPLALANTDYANFKKEILADKAQLQNADGVLMSADEAQTYVRSLP